MVSADLLLNSAGYLTAWFDWGVDTRIEFAVVTIMLALLLFAKEIVTTSKNANKKLSRALTIAILPLLVIFVINLAMVFIL